MREIKFKAWNNHLQVMTDDIHVLDSFNEYLSKDQYIVMQFIGKVDKNGTEIYENDILSISGVNRVVKFHNVAFILFADGKPLLHTPDWKTYEVIGNIHQDKHLLNG